MLWLDCTWDGVHRFGRLLHRQVFKHRILVRWWGGRWARHWSEHGRNTAEHTHTKFFIKAHWTFAFKILISLWRTIMSIYQRRACLNKRNYYEVTQQFSISDSTTNRNYSTESFLKKEHYYCHSLFLYTFAKLCCYTHTSLYSLSLCYLL